MLASTLQHYDINLTEAAAGTVTTAPVVPGVEPAKPGNEPTMTPPAGGRTRRRSHGRRGPALCRAVSFFNVRKAGSEALPLRDQVEQVEELRES